MGDSNSTVIRNRNQSATVRLEKNTEPQRKTVIAETFTSTSKTVSGGPSWLIPDFRTMDN